MNKDKRTRTLKLSILFSSFGPFTTLIALLMNTTMTQFADFTRRTGELVVLILALIVFRLLNRDTITDEKKRSLRRIIYMAVAVALLLSGVLLVGMSIQSVLYPVIPSGNVWLGLAIAGLGVLFNGFFWFRYRHFNAQANNTVMHTQSRLYKAKTIVDISVVVAFVSVLMFPDQWVSYWIDLGVTVVISVYLLYRSIRMMHESVSQ